jgi:predicted phosphodiesterase
MKLSIISDTHELHHNVKVPEGDILIHCGDWTNRGEAPAFDRFLTWFAGQPHKHKVFIAGNHELTLEGDSRESALNVIKEYTNKHSNLHFLENSSINIEGLNFYGTPTTPYYFGWAFNFQRGKDIAAEWKKIPDNVNVLITHGPSYGILDLVENSVANIGRDLHQGCQDLADRISNLKELKLHCCGHLHTDGGKKVEVNNIIYVNAAICTERYQPINNPVVVDL